jgi:hypothetical protein
MIFLPERYTVNTVHEHWAKVKEGALGHLPPEQQDIYEPAFYAGVVESLEFLAEARDLAQLVERLNALREQYRDWAERFLAEARGANH